MESRSDHRKIRKNWDQVFLMDDIYSLDFPIDRRIVAIRGQLNDHFVRYQMKYPPVSMLATPFQNHLYRTAEQRVQIDVYRVPSINHANLVPKTVPDDSSTSQPFAGNSDVVKFLFVFLDDENQMYRSNVRIDNMHLHHGLKRTFDLVLCVHWNTMSYVPNRQHDCRNPFLCPNKCRIFAVSANFQTDPNLACISIYPINNKRHMLNIENIHGLLYFKLFTWLYG